MNTSKVFSGSIISLVALISFAAFASFAHADAATWYVDSATTTATCASPDHACTSIGAAVAAAADGDTILVAEGTSYTEDVTVNKKLTLTGTAVLAANDPVIDGVVRITSGDVSFSGFKVTNANDAYGIVIDNVSNVSVTGNTIQDIGTTLTTGSAQGIYLEGSTGSAITNVTISGNTISGVGNANLAGPNAGGTSAKGIYIGDSASTGTITGLTVDGNTISYIDAETDAWPAGRGAYGVLVNFGGDTTATISNNQISMLEGLWAHGIGLEGNTPGTTLSGNTFGTLTDHKSPSDAHNVFFEDNASMTSVSVDGQTYGSTASVGVDAALAGTGGNPLVDINGQSYIFGVNAFGTIQEGINAVDAGGTVNVAAGTYTENLAISSHVKVVGDSAGGTIINPSTDNPIITLTGSGASASDPILLQNLKLNTDDSGTDMGKMTAIYIPNAANVAYVKMDNLTVTGNNHAYPGLESGIYVEMTANVSNLTIQNSTFQDLSYGLITNADPTTPGSFDTITITDSVFDHNSSKGMYFEKLSNATISNVQITDNGSDQSLMASWAKANGAGLDINLKYNAYSNITLDNLTVTGNGIGATNGTGVGMKARDDGSYAVNPASVTNAVLMNSTFSNNNVDVRVGEPGKSNAGPTGFKVNDSSLTSTGKGLVNDSTAAVDATSNWWGSASSPDGVAISGSGTSTVSFSPWYSDAAMTTLSSVTTTDAHGNTVTTTGGTEATFTGTSTASSSVTVSATIPADTTITGPAAWDGTIHAPTATTTSVALSGFTTSVTSAVSIGSDDAHLKFDKGVRLLFAGQAGARARWYTASGGYSEIDTTCASDSQATGNALPADGDCKIDVGADLVVWTKHFSTFVTYTASANTTTTTTTTSGGGGGGGGGGPVVALANNGGAAPTASTNTNTNTSSTGTVSTGGGQVLGASTHNFATDLTVGSTGADVTALQQTLIDGGFLKLSAPTGYFGALTKAAVMKYQAANGISPQSGYVGVKTRAILNAGTTPTMSDEQRSLLIQSLQQQLATLLAKIKALTGQQ